jgi:hypothetical protein
MIQLALVSRLLVARFGTERTWDFIEFITSPEGVGVWYFLFDRGPGHTRDFRGPRYFYKYESGLERLLD